MWLYITESLSAIQVVNKCILSTVLFFTLRYSCTDLLYLSMAINYAHEEYISVVIWFVEYLLYIYLFNMTCLLLL